MNACAFGETSNPCLHAEVYVGLLKEGNQRLCDDGLEQITAGADLPRPRLVLFDRVSRKHHDTDPVLLQDPARPFQPVELPRHPYIHKHQIRPFMQHDLHATLCIIGSADHNQTAFGQRAAQLHLGNTFVLDDHDPLAGKCRGLGRRYSDLGETGETDAHSSAGVSARNLGRGHCSEREVPPQVVLDEALHEGQAEVGLRHNVEVRWEARSAVLDFQDRLIVVQREANRDAIACRYPLRYLGMLMGIGDELIHHERQRRRCLRRQPHALRLQVDRRRLSRTTQTSGEQFHQTAQYEPNVHFALRTFMRENVVDQRDRFYLEEAVIEGLDREQTVSSVFLLHLQK